ncbi:unnamed protein product [Strongylus vulgaris]|uniref:Uncharacterized protein n=1 Tax=Strongylus vulgaris TaxID=40348 RepID=A0A3P7IKK7_STRVU|nr:unnamed protein product [Strongylus vulgaris]
MQSAGVPTFDEYPKFTSLYPMKCGNAEKIHDLVGVAARCMPDMNDIIIVSEDDQLSAEFCSRVLICKPGQGNMMCEKSSIKIWFPSTKKLVDKNEEKQLDYENIGVEKGEIIVNIDPKCELLLQGSHTMRHRFQNKPKKIREMMKKYPGFYLQPVFHHPRRLYRGGNSIFIGEPRLWMGDREILKSKDCNAECDEGQLHYFEMDARMPFYSKIFVDGAKCDWFKICIQGKEGAAKKRYYCKDADMINVFVRNGFVVMPKARMFL